MAYSSFLVRLTFIATCSIYFARTATFTESPVYRTESTHQSTKMDALNETSGLHDVIYLPAGTPSTRADKGDDGTPVVSPTKPDHAVIAASVEHATGSQIEKAQFPSPNTPAVSPSQGSTESPRGDKWPETSVSSSKTAPRAGTTTSQPRTDSPKEAVVKLEQVTRSSEMEGADHKTTAKSLRFSDSKETVSENFPRSSDATNSAIKGSQPETLSVSRHPVTARLTKKKKNRPGNNKTTTYGEKEPADPSADRRWPHHQPQTIYGPAGVGSDGTGSVQNCLLRSDLYRALVALLASLALLGNAGSLLYRGLVTTQESGHACGVLVSHLCVSDLLMGVYLVILAGADSYFGQNYSLYSHDWTHGSMCRLAGVLALMSCEVSAFLVCLLTLDRLLAIHWPHLGFSVRPTSARLLCCLAWALGLFLATVPIIESHWTFYGSVAICFPLPTTSRDFDGKDYAFGVFTMLNFALFLFVACGQLIVYWSLRWRRSSTPVPGGLKAVEEVEHGITRRLAILALLHALGWVPVCLLGFLASNGATVGTRYGPALALLVLPLGAALDPLLYTLPLAWPGLRAALTAGVGPLCRARRRRYGLQRDPKLAAESSKPGLGFIV